MKKWELQYQIDRNRAEDERRNSAAAKRKMFGVAMRNSAIRMGIKPIDEIPFFRNVEQLFEVYEVPAQLRAILIRPYLNDKAKTCLLYTSPSPRD